MSSRLAIVVMVGIGMLFGAKGIVDVISRGTESKAISPELYIKINDFIVLFR